MVISKSDFIIFCDKLRLQTLVAGSQKNKLTTILYHHFFFDGEDRETGRERLKRQCDWLRGAYSPLSATTAMNALVDDKLPATPLLVTIDDAKVQLMDVMDIFEDFEIPLALFVCVGWTDGGGPVGEDTALSRIVAKLHWYEGEAYSFDFQGRPMSVAPGSNANAIDDLIKAAELDDQISFYELANSVDQAAMEPSREICKWDEIAELASRGVEIGSHSVSHVRVGQQTDLRLRYEIEESFKVLSRKIGKCSYFAYPYGDKESFDQRTAALIGETGYKYSFVTKAGFTPTNFDPFELPRIVLPEILMSQTEFQARVRGGGIPLTAIKSLFAN